MELGGPAAHRPKAPATVGGDLERGRDYEVTGSVGSGLGSSEWSSYAQIVTDMELGLTTQ